MIFHAETNGKANRRKKFFDNFDILVRDNEKTREKVGEILTRMGNSEASLKEIAIYIKLLARTFLFTTIFIGLILILSIINGRGIQIELLDIFKIKQEKEK